MTSTEPTWKMIENRLQETLPERRIKSIKVIQNIFLWKKFQLEFDGIKKKHGDNPMVHTGWHGTSRTDP